MMDRVRRQMAVGVVWMTLFKFTVRGLGLISTVILARLLMPEDFGLVALAAAIVAGLELMSAFSFDVVLIQNQDADRSHYDSAWTLNILFRGSLSLLLVAISWPAAEFFSEPRLQMVLVLLAAGFLVQATEKVAVVNLRKELQFDKEFRVRVLQKLAAFCITIPLAFWLRNYWALVIGIVTGNIAGVVLSYMAVPYKPRFSVVRFGELFNFSKWLALNNVLMFLRVRSADFILGRISGPAELGIYRIADEIASLPTTELVMPINRAVFPGYARMAADLATLRNSYVEVVGFIALLAMPAGIGIAAVAHLAVPLMLGEKWLAAIPIVQILAVSGVLYALLANLGSGMLALGKPRLITWTVLGTLVVLLPLAVWLSREAGAVGLAWANLLAMPVYAALGFGLCLRLLQMRVTALLAVLWRPTLAAALMYVGVRLVFPPGAAVGGLVSLVGMTALAVGLGACIYVGAVLLLWRLAGLPGGPERESWGWIQRRLAA
jgi:O-antigen/teichoic acid export membrane protein